MRELLFNMVTAAHQTIPDDREHRSKSAGLPVPSTGPPPYHLGKCMSWDFNGPVVKRRELEFFGWQPLKKAAKPE